MISALVIGDDADLLEVDADIGQVFRDEADVLVLGPPGQDLVADHQDPGRDDFTHDFSSNPPLGGSLLASLNYFGTLPGQHVEIRWVLLPK